VLSSFIYSEFLLIHNGQCKPQDIYAPTQAARRELQIVLLGAIDCIITEP
jgi:hypothetical protein